MLQLLKYYYNGVPEVVWGLLFQMSTLRVPVESYVSKKQMIILTHFLEM